MAGKDTEYGSPLMQLVVEQLKKDKKASFADIKAAAKKKGLELYPITYGRAKALLGLVPSAKRGQGKAARERKRQARAASGAKRGPGRPPKQLRRRGPGRPRKNAAALASLDGFVAAMERNERTVAAYRSALERAFEILRTALS